MGLTKEQVQAHITGIEARVTQSEELKHYGYEFAKLCHKVKDYDNAIRYLTGYLSVNGRDHRAQKLMGRLCDTTGDHFKAIAHFKRSLELKKDQRDVIEAIASVYLKLEKPPLDSLKESLRNIEDIRRTHPLIVPLYEKIQSVEGGSSMEGVIKNVLERNPGDISLHIRLVQLYRQSDKLSEAFQYCTDLHRKGEFMNSLEWQQCALAIAEEFYENEKARGSKEVLQISITVLQFISALFNLVATPHCHTLTHSTALLLKFDKVLFASGQALMRASQSSLPLFRLSLVQFCAELYFMAGRYLYLVAQRLRQSVVGTANAESILRLGVMCLLSSVRVAPPVLEQFGAPDLGTQHQLRALHTAACLRISTAGHHLMIIEAVRRTYYFETLPKLITAMGGKLHLIKTLFEGVSKSLQVKFGSKDIKFSLQESFFAEDGVFLEPVTKLPTHELLELYDSVCIARVRELSHFLWRCLAYRALKKDPPVFSWLLRMLGDLRQDTPDLSSTEPGTVCVLDFEVLLTLLVSMYSERLTSPSCQLYSASPPATGVQLSTVLTRYLPSSITIDDQHIHYWESLLSFLSTKLRSAQDVVGLKRVVRECLGWVRGSHPLCLSLEQLVSLARHFNGRAELMADSSDGGEDRDMIIVLLKWSCHYWSIIEKVLTEKMGGTHASTPPVSPSSCPAQSDLLAEARMALANQALYQQDMSKALRLYSRVKTAHSAWNQSQIYLHLADVSSEPDTREKLDTKVDNLQKAADTLELAITRLTPANEKNLRTKLTLQKDEIKKYLGDTKKSPLACALDYDEESVCAPRRYSTPAHHMTPPLQQITSPFTDESLRRSLKEKDKHISAMAQQLEKLQAEMEVIKSRTPPPYHYPIMGSQGGVVYSPRPPYQGYPHNVSPGAYGPSSPTLNYRFQGQHSIPPHTNQPHRQWSPPQGLEVPFVSGQQTSPRAGYLTMSPPPNRVVVYPQQQSLSVQSYSTTPPQSALSQVDGGLQLPASHRQTPPQTSHLTQSLLYRSPQPGTFLPPHTGISLSPGLSLPQHLQSSSFIPSMRAEAPLTIKGLPFQSTNEGRSGLLFKSPASEAAAAVVETTPKDDAVSTPPSTFGVQNRSTLVPPGTSVTPPNIAASNALRGLKFGSPQSLAAKNPPTVPKSDEKASSVGGKLFPTTTTTLLGMQQQPFSFTASQPLNFNFSKPSSITFGKTTLTSAQPLSTNPTPFTAATVTSTSVCTAGKLTLPPTITNTSIFKLPVNIQPAPSTATTASSVSTFSMGLSGASLFKTAAPISTASWTQPFTTPGTTLFSTTLPQSTGTSEQPKIIATSKDTFPLLTSLLSSTSTTSKPSMTPAGKLSPKETTAVSIDGAQSLSAFGGSIFSGTTIEADNDQEESEEAHDRSDDGPQFTPIVSLTPIDNYQSGEENEEVLFQHRAKLYRFHDKEWKDKGIGEMKILKHNDTGKVRLLMRREQILKLCCNHYLAPGMKFHYFKDSHRMLCWFTNAEFSDEEAKPEKLAAKFKTDEIAAEFKTTAESAIVALDEVDVINESSQSAQQLEPDGALRSSSDIRQRLAPPKNSWSCEVCLINNNESAKQCIACSAENPNWTTVKSLMTSGGNEQSFATPSLTDGIKLTFPPSTTITTAPTSGGIKLTLPPSTAVTTSPTSGGIKLTLPPSTAVTTSPTSGGIKLTLPPSTAVTTAPTSGGIKLTLPPSTAVTTAPTSGGIKLTLPPSIAVTTAPTSGGIKLTLPPSTAVTTAPTSGGIKLTLPPSTAVTRAPTSGGIKLTLPPSTAVTRAPTSGGIKLTLPPSTAVTTSPTSGGIKLTLPPSTAITTAPTSGGIKLTLPPSTAVTTAPTSDGFKLGSSASLFGGSSASQTGASTTVPPLHTTSSATAPAKGSLPTTTSSSDGPIFGLLTNTTAPSGGFNFSLITKTTASSAGFNFSLPTKTIASSGGFKFSLPTNTTTSSGGFNFSLPTKTMASSGGLEFSLLTNTTTSSGGFNFSQPTKTTTFSGGLKFSLPTNTTASSGGFKFSPPTNTTVSSSGFNFSLPTKTTASSGGFSLPTNTFGEVKFSLPTKTTAQSSRFAFSQGSSTAIASGLASSTTTTALGSENATDISASKPLARDDDEQEDEQEEEYKPDTFFQPVVTLEELPELQTGEEGLEVLFEHHAKLYRFDSSSGQWKDRGVGDMKILKNPENQKFRLIMRRDQVKTICCNHYLTASMTLTPMTNSNKAWTWFTLNDFTDGVSKPEKLALKFKEQETAEEFKSIIDEAISQLHSTTTGIEPARGEQDILGDTSERASLSDQDGDSTDQSVSDDDEESLENDSEKEQSSGCPLTLSQIDVTGEFSIDHDYLNNDNDAVILLHEEMPQPDKVELAKKYLLPVTFYNYENKLPCSGCRGCVDDMETPNQPLNASKGAESDSFATLGGAEEKTLAFQPKEAARDKPQATKEEPTKKSFSLFPIEGKVTSFSELTSAGGFQWSSSTKQGFSGAGQLLFSSSTAADGEEDNPEAEANITFKPIVTLTKVEVKTGEESDDIAFSHRAKLFRFDSKAGQWKERGVGNIKIMRNRITNKTRLIMRRDQIMKLCCNHYITPNMELLANQGSNQSWVWSTPCDFSDGEAKPEKLAIRFKYPETAAEFKKHFDKCKALKVIHGEDVSEDTSDKPDSVDKNDESSPAQLNDNSSKDTFADTKMSSNIQAAEDCEESSQTPKLSLRLKLAPPPGTWTCTECLVPNSPDVCKCVACGAIHKSGTTPLSATETPELKGVEVCTPDSSTNKNPLLRFPLNMSPVSKVPYICPGKMPALEKEDPLAIAKTAAKKVESKVPYICPGKMPALEKEDPLAIAKTAAKKVESEPVLLREPKPECKEPQTDSNDSVQDEEVVFLYEELPDEDLVAKARHLMLPPSFFLYRGKNPCPGCRGCQEEIFSQEVTFVSGGDCSPSTSILSGSPEMSTPSDSVSSKQPVASTQASKLSGFFSSSGLVSFSDLMPQDSSGFTKATPGFQFHGTGKQLFAAKTEEDADPEAEANITFKPIVTLTRAAPVKHWEDDADTLFTSRAKLFRFDDSSSQWKERGVGDMKILRHRETGRSRVMMRREQILKICCNHYITAGMVLIPGQNEKSWVWLTQADMTDEEPKHEKLAIRFKHAETAGEFKSVFEQCVEKENASIA